MKNKTEDVLNKVYLWDRKIGKKDSGKHAQGTKMWKAKRKL